jgi:outer membrane protein
MFYTRVLRASALALLVAAVPVGAQAESLRQALTSAYANNPNLGSSLLAAKAAAEDIVSAKAGTMPKLGFGASITDNFSFAGPGGQTNGQTASLGLNYGQTLYDSGLTDARVEQARALTEVAKQAMRNSEQNVLLEVVQSYMGVIRDSQLVRLRQDNVSFLQAQVKSSQDRLDIGEGTKLDVSQAQTSLATGIASMKAAQASLLSSQASYQRWVGHKPNNLSQDFNFRGMLPNSMNEALSVADVYHPAILSAKAAIRASQAGVDVAQAAFGPTIDVSGSLGVSRSFGDSDLGRGSPVTGSLGLSLSIPIYAGGALGAGVRKANLGQMKSEVDAQATRDQVHEAVITAWSTLQNSVAQIDAAQQALDASGLALDATVQSRDVGQSTTLDVLDAQATVTQSREALVQATTSRIIASFALVASEGKLSAQTLQLPVEVKSADSYAATVEDVWQELRDVPNQ